MTTGALIFAFNNEKTDYVQMAAWSAERIRRFLEIPVAVVTDLDPGDSRVSGFDRVITADATSGGTRWFEDYQNTVTWYNAGRVDAYSLSPWQRTLVLDADYVVNSTDLKTVLTADTDFLCHRWAMSLATAEELDSLNYFGRHHMPMSWATVMMFQKSTVSQYIFDCMHMVRENWQHYRDLYAIDRPTYRNDFALSIALGIVNGHTPSTQTIPWPLMTVMPDQTLRQIDDTMFEIEYADSDKQAKTVSWRGVDFHAMGKQHLEKIIAAH